MDFDIKGLAYEHFLKYEMGGGDLGQFFTRREVVNYMINIIKPNIKETSTFFDPFAGTDGFLSHIFNVMREMYIKNKIPLTDAIKNNMINGIEKNPQTCLLGLNNMLLNMDIFPTNIKCDDSFRNYINQKYDFVLTNPPFGIKGLAYDDENMFPKEKNGVKKNKYLPYKSNDAICLALQMINYILNKNGIGAIVVPDGKQMSGVKEKSLIAVRKMLIEENNLFQITKLPSGTFLPYTGVETMILFFKKGEKTKDIKFVKLDEKYKNETILCNVNIKKIIDKNYSLNYKLYIDNNKNLHTNIEYKELSEVFDYLKGTIQSSKIENNENGKYSFVTGADDLKFKKINLIENQKLLSGENLFVSHRGNGDTRPVKYYNGECYYSDLLTLLKPKIDINLKFAYYFLKFNQKYIENNYQKGACNKTLDFALFNQMKIPIPPNEVQNLIVQELDSMCKQKESLQIAINEMNNYLKVQFEMLLTKCKDVKIEKFVNICKFKSGKQLSKEKIINGEYPVIGGGRQPTGYHNEYNRDENTILCSSSGCSAGLISKYSKKIWASDCFSINSNDTTILNELYLYVYLKYIQENIYKLQDGIAQPHIYSSSFEKIELILPSLKDQELIVQQMEKYDELVKLQQAQIDEIDTTIKARFEFHLNKCKEAKPTKSQTKEKLEDDSSNSSSTKKILIKSKPKNNNDEDFEDEYEEQIQQTQQTSSKIKIDEITNKSTKSIKSTKSAKNKEIKEVNKEVNKEINEEIEEEINEIYIIGKVECINEDGNYYKFINGKKGELYAKTLNGKVILHKKSLIKKV